MKIERTQLHPGGRVYYTVLVDRDELICNGKPMRFSTWVGTIGTDGTINLWRPACGAPRGYRQAAMAKLEEARRQLREEAVEEPNGEASQ